MLAELADQTAHDRMLRRRDLVFEPKYDGIRALVAVEPGQLRSIFARLDRIGDLWSGLRLSEPANLEAVFAYEDA